MNYPCDDHCDVPPPKPYTQTLSAILRLLLICILLGAWVAAATGFNFDINQLNQGDFYNSTFAAFLVITIVAFIVSIVIFLISLFGLSLVSVFLLFDMIFLLAVTGVSIAMAIAASDFEQVSSLFDTSGVYRQGSFAAAAALGLLSFFFYFALIIINSRKLRFLGAQSDDFY